MVLLFFEIIMAPILLSVIGLQLIAGVIAKNNGRSFWFWFWISFLIPVISIIILFIIPDKNPDKSIPVADHVKQRKPDPEDQASAKS